jgi:membrane fusion protein
MSTTPQNSALLLFREEALTAAAFGSFGRPGKNRRAALNIGLAIFALCLLLASSMYAYFGQYTRKATVKVVVVPAEDNSHLVSPLQAVVREVLITEGEQVSAGTPLFKLATDFVSRSGETHALLEQSINEQILLIHSRKILTKNQRDNKVLELSERLERLTEQKATLQRERQHLADLLATKQQELHRLSILRQDNAVSATTYDQARQDVLLSKIDLQKLSRSQQALDADMKGIPHEITQTHTRHDLELADFDHQLLALEKDKINNERAQEVFITALTDGVITALNIEPGQYVTAGTTLATLAPSDLQVKVHLYIPPDDMGFIEPGQITALRFTAYPYQKYGTGIGTLKHIARSPYITKEMPQNLANILEPNQTYYKAVVELQQQYVNANAARKELKPGLVLEADLLLEQRKIYEWLLAPLYAFTRKTL